MPDDVREAFASMYMPRTSPEARERSDRWHVKDQMAELVLNELTRAEVKFPSMHSPHEGLAIIEEEFLEFRQEVFWGTRERQREECIQLAAMAIRFLCDFGETDGEKPA